MMKPLRERLATSVELRFPHFEKQYQISRPRPRALAFTAVDCRDWYAEFRERVLAAEDDHRFFPVYRMCDGEFAFALHRWQGRYRGPGGTLRGLIGRVGGAFWQRVMGEVHRSGSVEYGFESYSAGELAAATGRFVESLRVVAERGVLALCLHDTPLARPYIPAILDWLEHIGVRLDAANYYHFYSVYVLLHGPDRVPLLRDRRVLVVTSLTPEKKKGVERGLQRAGVRDVQFASVSSSKALLDTVRLEDVVEPVDVVLVGAGIGAANVLAQLEPLSAPVIDVGFGLSTLADPELRWRRPLCVPDDEFDVVKVAYN